MENGHVFLRIYNDAIKFIETKIHKQEKTDETHSIINRVSEDISSII